jgi:enoyl-CoA hydratase
MPSADPILFDADADGIVLVTFNRPGTLNSADEELHAAVATAWDRAAAIPGARAIVLTGAGKAFSGGGDLGLLARMVADVELRAAIIREAGTIVRSMIACPLPIVAAVNGPAVGLGCSLASMSDLVVMEEDAYLADPHVALGLVAGDGGVLTWPLNMGLQRSKEFLLLGSRIPARQALELGLANRARGAPKNEGSCAAKPGGQTATRAGVGGSKGGRSPPWRFSRRAFRLAGRG